MSGFVAISSQTPDPEHQAQLSKMSEQIAHRGDIESTQVFTGKSACVTRHRAKSGYSVDTHSDDEYSIVLDSLLFNQEIKFDADYL